MWVSITHTEPNISGGSYRCYDERRMCRGLKTLPDAGLYSQPPRTQPTAHQLKTALLKHGQEQGHSIDWENWRILSKDNRTYKVLIRESLEIQRRKPTLNRTTTSGPLIVFSVEISTPKPTVKLK